MNGNEDRTPVVLVFDSGVGGLSVFAQLRKARPDVHFIYVADDAGFPYGPKAAPVLLDRVVGIMGGLIARYTPDLVVIACNTAATLVLPGLRARFPLPFIGTVPAIKPAAAQSVTRAISILATPGTVHRDYTHDLIRDFAGDCAVTLVGSTQLAGYAEAELAGTPVADELIRAAVAPAFVDHDGRCTDTVVLACTHYPLLLPRFEALAPWPVSWIDPAPAIARRMVQLIGPAVQPAVPDGSADFILTSGRPVTAPLASALASYGLWPLMDGHERMVPPKAHAKTLA